MHDSVLVKIALLKPDSFIQAGNKRIPPIESSVIFIFVSLVTLIEAGSFDHTDFFHHNVAGLI